MSSPMYRRTAGLAALLVAGLAVSSSARNTDGTLAVIRTPNNGMPALVTPGHTFQACLSHEAPLHLVGGDTRIPLETKWETLPGDRRQADCRVPQNAAPGCYALQAGDGSGEDTNLRAVYVLESFPDTYVIAHLSDTHVGSGRHERPADDIFRDTIKTINESEAAFVLITGDLTDTGKRDEFRDFLAILDTCDLPTFVCAGNHDRLALNYENTFGPLTYTFWFGQDAYLVFDTKDFITADELGAQDADLQRFRRAIKPARWSIGVTHRYEPNMGMRSQITLFVDNPLDMLLFGHWHRINTAQEKRVPWGTSHISVAPAAVDGLFRFVVVTPQAILPSPPEQAASIR